MTYLIVSLYDLTFNDGCVNWLTIFLKLQLLALTSQYELAPAHYGLALSLVQLQTPAQVPCSAVITNNLANVW